MVDSILFVHCYFISLFIQQMATNVHTGFSVLCITVL